MRIAFDQGLHRAQGIRLYFWAFKDWSQWCEWGSTCSRFLNAYLMPQYRSLSFFFQKFYPATHGSKIAPPQTRPWGLALPKTQKKRDWSRHWEHNQAKSKQQQTSAFCIHTTSCCDGWSNYGQCEHLARSTERDKPTWSQQKTYVAQDLTEQSNRTGRRNLTTWSMVFLLGYKENV